MRVTKILNIYTSIFLILMGFIITMIIIKFVFFFFFSILIDYKNLITVLIKYRLQLWSKIECTSRYHILWFTFHFHHLITQYDWNHESGATVIPVAPHEVFHTYTVWIWWTAPCLFIICMHFSRQHLYINYYLI